MTGSDTVQEPVSASTSALGAVDATLTSSVLADLSLTSEDVPKIQEAGLNISLLEDCVQLNLPKGVVKHISYDDFIESLKTSSADSNKTKQLLTAELPKNTTFFQINEKDILLQTYHPECIRNIQYVSRDGTKYNRASVIPNILLTYALDRKDKALTIRSVLYMATPKKFEELPNGLCARGGSGFFYLPFTNVYDNGTLCFGNNVMPSKYTLPNLRGLHWYYEFLFSSPFNEDLGVKVRTFEGRRLYPSEWFEMLANKAAKNEPFPYDLLM